MLLVTMKPPVGAVPYSLVDRDGVDDQRIALPVAALFAVEGGIRVLGMRTPIGGDHAIVVIGVDQFHQLSRRLHELHTMEARANGWNAKRRALPGHASYLYVEEGFLLVLRQLVKIPLPR